MSIIEVLEASTVISTIIQFLSGSLICKNYIQKKSTGETSGIPFLCGFLSCCMWFNYGSLVDQSSIQLVNIIGATLFFFYSMVYFVFCTSKKQYVQLFGLTLLTLAGTAFYTYGLEEHIDQVRVMGLVACVFSVCFFGAPLTKLFHVIRVKNSESLPLPMIATSFLVSLQWLIYGVLLSDTFIQVPNFLGCILCITQLCLFVVYPPKNYYGQGYKLVDQSTLQFT